MQEFVNGYILRTDCADLAGQIAKYFEKDVEKVEDIIEDIESGKNPFETFTGGRKRKNFAFEQLQHFIQVN